ncbi:MAG: alpha/beta hydrolase [Chloroflexi bacterium]|nr:alpha/beta hydrolase [Chloroflexota bacterium]
MRVNIGDTTLYFDVDGESLAPDGPEMREKPTLLLLHGGPGFDHTSFKPLFSQLTDIAQVIYLDHRGMGRSDRDDPSNWDLDQWAQDVKAFCDSLGIVKPIVLGLSFGAMVVTKYAGMFPDHPSKVAICSGTARFDEDIARDWFEKLGGPKVAEKFTRFMREGTSVLDEYLAAVMPIYNRTPQDPDSRKRAVITRTVLDHFFGSEIFSMDLRPDLANITCPTLVLSGDTDPMTPRTMSDEIAKLLVNSDVRYEVIENAGHGPWRDRPEETMTILREFISA